MHLHIKMSKAKRKRGTLISGPSYLYYNKLDIFQNQKPVCFLLLGERHHKTKDVVCDRKGYECKTVREFIQEKTKIDEEAEFWTTFDFYFEASLRQFDKYTEGCSMDNIDQCFRNLDQNVRKHRVDLRKANLDWFDSKQLDNLSLVNDITHQEGEDEVILMCLMYFFIGLLPFASDVDKKKHTAATVKLKTFFDSYKNDAMTNFIDRVLKEEGLTSVKSIFKKAYDESKFKEGGSFHSSIDNIKVALYSKFMEMKEAYTIIEGFKKGFVSQVITYMFQGWAFLMDIYTLLLIFKDENKNKQNELLQKYQSSRNVFASQKLTPKELKQELGHHLIKISKEANVSFVIYYTGLQHSLNLRRLLRYVFKGKYYKEGFELVAEGNDNCILLDEDLEQQIFGKEKIKQPIKMLKF